jgi:hypothetical protein
MRLFLLHMADPLSMVALVEDVLVLYLHLADPLYKIDRSLLTEITDCCCCTWQIHYLKKLEVNTWSPTQYSNGSSFANRAYISDLHYSNGF